MRTRLLCLGLLVTAGPLLGTGCHPIERWRANHPGLACGACVGRPLLHPIQTRRAILAEPVGPVGPITGPVVGPISGPGVGPPACHGCGSSQIAPGVPVGFGAGPAEVFPVTHPPVGYPPIGYPPAGYPTFGAPMPITPGPTVTPSTELPAPMPVKPPVGN